MTMKQYFDNALQEQKGLSDAVEQKNRIRRLIKHFFTDRDCYTMVRPTENEKDLQNLNNIDPSNLRQEFVSQMGKLKSKIFTRVKPKMLNNKFLTGKMLLELCHSYCEAINTGTVPNIQNAWSYVCQNECARAIQEATLLFSNELKDALSRAKQDTNMDILKTANRYWREQAVSMFRSKAFGQETEKFEQTLRDELQKKFKAFKTEFIRFAEQKARDFINPDIENFKKNLQEDFYDNMEKVMVAIEKIKVQYNEGGPKFPTSQLVLMENVNQLIVRAAEFLTINTRKEKEGVTQRNKEKVEELENQLTILKSDINHERQKFQSQVQDLETQKNDSFKKEKILEERLKQLVANKEKDEKAISDKNIAKIQESEGKLKSIETLYKKMEDELKNANETNVKKAHEYEKGTALMEQKLELIEAELKDYKDRYSQKDKDIRDNNKELSSLRKELQNKQQELHEIESDKNEEIQKMRHDHEQQIAELSRDLTQALDNQGVEHRSPSSNKRVKELESLNQQLQTQMLQFMQNPTVSQPASAGMSKQDLEKINQKKEILKQEKNQLQNANFVLQEKVTDLEKKTEKFKRFRDLVINSNGMCCKICQKMFGSTEFSTHLSSCKQEMQRQSNIMASQMINGYKMFVEKVIKKNSTFFYEIRVLKQFSAWKVMKSYSQLQEFIDDMQRAFPDHNIKELKHEENLASGNEKHYSEVAKRIIQTILSDFCQMPQVRECPPFKEFFQMNTADENNHQMMRMSLNPFAKESQLSYQNKFDGRRSMSSMYGQQQDNLFAQEYTMPEQAQQMIQEEDESEISSMNSKNRGSNLFSGGDHQRQSQTSNYGPMKSARSGTQVLEFQSPFEKSARREDEISPQESPDFDDYQLNDRIEMEFEIGDPVDKLRGRQLSMTDNQKKNK